MQNRAIKTKQKILTVCVRLFLERGYKETTVSEIIEEAGVARGSYLNLFPKKDTVLLELVKTMFGSQFDVAKAIVKDKSSPVYIYAVETAIQLILTEQNENLRELYTEAYTLPDTAEYLYKRTTAELMKIFKMYFPTYIENDFYCMEIGTSGLMRNYMAKKCDDHLSLEKKIQCFLTAALRIYKVPEEELDQIFAFVAGLDINAIAREVMQKMFFMLEPAFSM